MMDKRDAMRAKSMAANKANMMTKRKAGRNMANAMQEQKDEEMMRGAGAAYDKAMPGYAKGGMVGKGGGMARPKKCKMY
jgi:hypothetical protein